MSSTGRKISHERGCYGCGHWPIKFGGTVQPAIFNRFLNILEPKSALWWTDCPKCGRIEVTE